MGILLWIACGLIAAGLARLIPDGRPAGRLSEAFASAATALVLGFLATALDFGGWRTPDLRAALFIVCGSFAAIGIYRAVRLASQRSPAC